MKNQKRNAANLTVCECKLMMQTFDRKNQTLRHAALFGQLSDDSPTQSSPPCALAGLLHFLERVPWPQEFSQAPHSPQLPLIAKKQESVLGNRFGPMRRSGPLQIQSYFCLMFLWYKLYFIFTFPHVRGQFGNKSARNKKIQNYILRVLDWQFVMDAVSQTSNLVEINVSGIT